MIRNLKILGLPVLAALAMSAVAASAAQAQSGTLTTGTTPSIHTATTLIGEQEGSAAENFLELLGIKLTCKTVDYAAASTGTDTELSVTASYKDCESPTLYKPMTVNMTSCFYTFTQPSTDANEKMTGLVDLKCNAGDFIDVTIFSRNGTDETPKNTNHTTPIFCNTRLFPKDSLEHVIYTNGGTKNGFDDLTLDLVISDFKLTGKGTCTGGLDLIEEGAKYESKITVFSETDDVWMSE